MARVLDLLSSFVVELSGFVSTRGALFSLKDLLDDHLKVRVGATHIRSLQGTSLPCSTFGV